MRHGQYYSNVANVHARLALACIKIIDWYYYNLVLLLRREFAKTIYRFKRRPDHPGAKYARKYWAKHLCYSRPCTEELRISLRRLTISFFRYRIDRSDAHVVVQWLRVCESILARPETSILIICGIDVGRQATGSDGPVGNYCEPSTDK